MASIFQFLQRRESTGSTSATTSATTTGTSGTYGNNVVQVNSQTAALSIAAFHRALELRANTMSQLVMEYQKKRSSDCGGNYEADNRADGRVKNYLLQVQPNPTMTWVNFIKQAEINRIIYGNAVAYIERDEVGEPVHFWLATWAQYNKTDNTYNITINMPQAKSFYDVKPADVIHIRNTYSNDCGLTGVATLFYAQKALSLAATNDKLVTDNAAKGGKLKLLVQEEKSGSFGLGRANQKQLEKITTQLNEDIYSSDVVLLNNIASVTPISQTMQAQEIQVARQFSVREIARFTGTPAIMLMDDSGSSYKSPEAATQEYLLRTITPAAHDWEVELNAKLLGPAGYPEHRYHFNDESLMRLDPLGRANISKIQLECGIKCVNELRAERDLPSLGEIGDKHYISTNLAELGSRKLSEPASASSQPVQQEPTTEPKKEGDEQ